MTKNKVRELVREILDENGPSLCERAQREYERMNERMNEKFELKRILDDIQWRITMLEEMLCDRIINWKASKEVKK